MRPPRNVFAAILAVLIVPLVPEGGATTLVPMDGDEQIDQSVLIFRGRVSGIEVVRETAQPGAPIVSHVEFEPLATYKGSATSPVRLTFLGGRIGDVALKVDGMPEFEEGAEYVLFVTDEGNTACPVVGWSEGSLKVERLEPQGSRGWLRVSPAASAWLRRSALANSRMVMPAALELAQFESFLRGRIADLRSAP